jgi:hypothetical protein
MGMLLSTYSIVLVNLFLGGLSMDDYISVLLLWLSENRYAWKASSIEYAHCERTAEQATRALLDTFTPEQTRLFLDYEETHTALFSADMDAFARQSFLLAREIFR